MHTFQSFHPAITLFYFVCAICLSIVFDHPLMQVTGLLCAVICYACVKRRDAWKGFALLAIAFMVLTLVNPLFNIHGTEVLAVMPWGSPYTLQALLFGASTAAMFITVLLWFFTLSAVMTNDSLMFLFGRFAPAITLVCVMVLRFVPSYKQRAQQVLLARNCIGKGLSQGSIIKRARSGLMMLFALMNWSLEESITASDSMQSRGFGAACKSTYLQYCFSWRDYIALGVSIMLLVITLIAGLSGFAIIDYFSDTIVFTITPMEVIAAVAYASFLLSPVLLYLVEEVSWHLSLSKI